jgi:hypothetical protein
MTHFYEDVISAIREHNDKYDTKKCFLGKSLNMYIFGMLCKITFLYPLLPKTHLAKKNLIPNKDDHTPSFPSAEPLSSSEAIATGPGTQYRNLIAQSP